jgi:hypothetical protein
MSAPIANGGRDVNPAVQYLATIDRWVCWKLERRTARDGKVKETKPPYCVGGRRKADSTDPATWATFDACWRSAFVDGAATGVGIVLVESDPDHLMAADIDQCIGEDGAIAPWALEAVRMLNSYTERSPSGCGLRVFFLGTMPDKGRKVRLGDGHVELYRAERYLTVTGDHLDGSPEAINAVEPSIIAQLLGPPVAKTNGAAAPQAEQIDNIHERAEELRERFQNTLKSDANLRAIWRGETPPAGHDQTRSAWDLKLAAALRRHHGFSLADFAAIASKWRCGKGADGDPRHWSRTWAKAEPDEAPDQITWPHPLSLPEGLPHVEPFALELMPEAFRPWVEDAAKRMQTPPDYIAVAIMVATGAVVGRQLGIRPKQHDDWTVVPNLWGIAIGSPGLLKTASLEEGLRPIRTLEHDAKLRFETEQRIWKARIEIESEAKKIRAQKIREQLKAHRNRDNLAREIADDQSEIPEPKRRRFITNDATVEKLGELLRDNPNGIIQFRDELMGWLKSLEQEGRGADRAFYLEAWNGTGRFSYDRISRGTIDIEAACVSVLGSIQPGPLLAYLESKAWDGENADGILQRFQLAAWPDPQPTWRNIDAPPDAAARDLATAVFQRLAAISPDGKNKTLRFDSGAQDAFDAWRSGLEQRLRAGNLHPAVEAHLAKYRSLLPALALICHVADHDHTTPVGQLAVARAEAWLEYLESHAARIYDCLIRPDQSATRALGERIITGALNSPFSLRDVYRPNWSGLTTRDTAQEAVDVLVDLNWLRVEEIRPPGRGRPTTHYHVNPKVREKLP